jgi:hypothetical protein
VTDVVHSNREARMVSIPEIVAVISCGFVLCVGLTYAAHPSAEVGPTTGKASQVGKDI